MANMPGRQKVLGVTHSRGLVVALASKLELDLQQCLMRFRA